MALAISSNLDPQFIASIFAGLAYWRECTKQIDSKSIGELDAQRQNLSRIIEYGLVLPQTWHDSAVIALQAFAFIEQRGYWHEWILVLQQCVENFAEDESRLKLKLLNRLGQLYRLTRQLPSSIETHQKARTVAKKLGSPQLIAEVDYNLAEDFLQSREYEKVETYGQAALNSFIDLPDTVRWRAATLNTLGKVAHSYGDLELAEYRLSTAVELRRVLDQPIQLARILNDLATTLQAAHKIEEARQCLMEASEILAPTINELDKAMVQINLGLLYFRQEKWMDAVAAYRQVNSNYLHRSGNITYQATISHNLGEVLIKLDKLEEAETHLRDSIKLWRQTGDNLFLANSLGVLGFVLSGLKKKSETISKYEEATKLLKNYPNDAWARQLLEQFSIKLASVKSQ